MKTWQKIKLKDNIKDISQKLEQKYKVMGNMKENKEKKISPEGSILDKQQAVQKERMRQKRIEGNYQSNHSKNAKTKGYQFSEQESLLNVRKMNEN